MYIALALLGVGMVIYAKNRRQEERKIMIRRYILTFIALIVESSWAQGGLPSRYNVKLSQYGCRYAE